MLQEHKTKVVSDEMKMSTLFPVYNVHFFPAEKAPKIEMRIIPRILCVRLASLISMSTNTQTVSIHNHLLLIEKLKTEPIRKHNYFDSLKITHPL